MQGLISEAGQVTEEEMAEPLTDSAILCAAQKVEHYEIARLRDAQRVGQSAGPR
jgi:ferritin-like metal-binding protein YciE